MEFIKHDHSGTLINGAFFRLEYGDIFDDPRRDETWINIEGEHDIFVDVISTIREKAYCANGHVFGRTLSGTFDMRTDTLGLAFSSTGGGGMISSDVNRMLERASFTNYRAAPLNPEPYSRYQRQIWILSFTDLPMERSVVYRGVVPKCLACGAPMECSACKMIYGICRSCRVGKTMYFASEEKLSLNASDLGLMDLPVVLPALPPVVDGSVWNGEDFVGLHSCSVVTRRVIDVFQQLKVGPVYAEPIKVWVDNCSKTQLKLIENLKTGT